MLNAGEYWQVGFDRGDANTCVWDVKVVTMDGIELKIPELNLCAISDLNINT